LKKIGIHQHTSTPHLRSLRRRRRRRRPAIDGPSSGGGWCVSSPSWGRAGSGSGPPLLAQSSPRSRATSSSIYL
ncbi:Os05g0326600, partial [Oryza sativa Japonica Group]